MPPNVFPPVKFALLFSCVCTEEVTPDRYPSSVEVVALDAKALDASSITAVFAVSDESVTDPVIVGFCIVLFIAFCVAMVQVNDTPPKRGESNAKEMR